MSKNTILDSKHEWIKANCPRSVRVRNLYLLGWGISNRDGRLLANVDGIRVGKNGVAYHGFPKALRATLTEVFDAFDAEYFPQPLGGIIAEIDAIGKGRLK